MQMTCIIKTVHSLTDVNQIHVTQYERTKSINNPNENYV